MLVNIDRAQMHDDDTLLGDLLVTAESNFFHPEE